jgi:hypothetical protein
MREIGADGIGLDNRPVSSGPFQCIRQLHHARAVLHVEFNLSLRAIALYGDLLHDGVERLEIQCPLVRQVRLNGDANLILGAGGTLLAPSQKDQERKG